MAAPTKSSGTSGVSWKTQVPTCGPELLERVKNQEEASFLQSLRGTGIASSLARMEVAYEWEFIEEQYRRRMAVTPEDLMRVARKYFTRDNSVTGVLERER